MQCRRTLFYFLAPDDVIEVEVDQQQQQMKQSKQLQPTPKFKNKVTSTSISQLLDPQVSINHRPSKAI